MTVNELRDYLAKYVGHGDEIEVLVGDKRDNPATDGNCIEDAVFLEWKNGDCVVVLQTD